MQALRVLLVTAELAPFSGDGEAAQAFRALARALCKLRRRVTVTAVTRAVPGRDPGRWGLARRLEPVRVDVGGDSVLVHVHEGTLPGGGVNAMVVDVGDHPSPYGVLTRLAFATAGPDNHPHIVHTFGTEADTIETARSLSLDPTTQAIIVGMAPMPSPFPQELADALAECDCAVAGSFARAASLRQDEALVAALSSADKIRGIPSGIDETNWNPERDYHLPANFSAEDLSGKATCKRELQKKCGLAIRQRPPLLFVADPAPPFDEDSARALAGLDIQVLFAADCPPLAELATKHPERFRRLEGELDATRERQVMAGCDLVLFSRAPGEFGFSRLSCLAFGAIPIAPNADLASDLLVEVDASSATGSGFLYRPGCGPEEILAVIRRAVRTVEFEVRARLAASAMRVDQSWRTAAERYMDVYSEALRRRAEAEQLAS